MATAELALFDSFQLTQSAYEDFANKRNDRRERPHQELLLNTLHWLDLAESLWTLYHLKADSRHLRPDQVDVGISRQHHFFKKRLSLYRKAFSTGSIHKLSEEQCDSLMRDTNNNECKDSGTLFCLLLPWNRGQQSKLPKPKVELRSFTAIANT